MWASLPLGSIGSLPLSPSPSQRHTSARARCRAHRGNAKACGRRCCCGTGGVPAVPFVALRRTTAAGQSVALRGHGTAPTAGVACGGGCGLLERRWSGGASGGCRLHAQPLSLAVDGCSQNLHGKCFSGMTWCGCRRPVARTEADEPWAAPPQWRRVPLSRYARRSAVTRPQRGRRHPQRSRRRRCRRHDIP